jgi:hypothetical protein
MPKFTGTVRRNDLEGGFYELHTDDGAVFRLEGGGDLTDGRRVVVHGKVDQGGFGFHMTGPSLKVDRIESA